MGDSKVEGSRPECCDQIDGRLLYKAGIRTRLIVLMFICSFNLNEETSPLELSQDFWDHVLLHKFSNGLCVSFSLWSNGIQSKY